MRSWEGEKVGSEKSAEGIAHGVRAEDRRQITGDRRQRTERR